MRMEVRCCCRPDVLLGWLEVPESVHIDVCLPVLVESETMPIGGTIAPVRPLDAGVVLRRSTFVPLVGAPYAALKADGVSLEQLCRVRGFTPAPR